MSGVIKKVAAIHDLSGVGRCSLTAAMPILSVLKVQPCPLPTAVLSCQTGFSKFSFLDLTEEMKKIEESWRIQQFQFDGIYSGFLGSEEQIEIVRDVIKAQKNSLVFIDPVMGDNGEIYKTYTKEMCDKMSQLVKEADVVTPNLTEACLLTNNDFRNKKISHEYLLDIAKEITAMGPKKVVITGIVEDKKIGNFAYDKEKNENFHITVDYNNISYSGTGDVFASILCGMLINNYEFKKSVVKATDFIYKVIKYSLEVDSDPRNGVIFEPLLKELII